MMDLLVITFYIFILSFLVYKSSFFNSLFPNNKTIIPLLASLKMLAGIFYMYYHYNFENAGDINCYIADGQIIYEQLQINPLHYIELTFGLNNTQIPVHLETPIYAMGFWEDTSAYLIVRFNAVVRLFSFGNVYVHGLFSGFFSFVGCYFIALTIKENLKLDTTSIVSIFLFPPILYWTSGPHKEFVSIFGLGLLLFGFFKSINENMKIKYLLISILGFCILGLVRVHIAIFFIPSLLAFLLVKKFNFKIIFTYLIVFIVFILASSIFPNPLTDSNLIDLILSKKQDFKVLNRGNTIVELNEYNNFKDILFSLPQALLNTISRPFVWEIKNIKLAFISIESSIISIIIVLGMFSFKKLNYNQKNIMFLMISFSFTYLILVGLIVPNWGAIIRYRSIALVLIIPIFIFLLQKNTFFQQLRAKF